jgi:hypothetical protein
VDIAEGSWELDAVQAANISITVTRREFWSVGFIPVNPPNTLQARDENSCLFYFKMLPVTSAQRLALPAGGRDETTPF